MLKTKKEVLTRAVKTKSHSFVGEIAHEDALIDTCRAQLKRGLRRLLFLSQYRYTCRI